MDTAILKTLKSEKKRILIVDLDENAVKYLPAHILGKNLYITSHSYFDTSYKILQKTVPSFIRKVVRKIPWVNGGIKKLFWTIDRYRGKKISPETRLIIAEEQLKRLANAQVVITSRLHAALPAIAFGTPVIFVHRNLNDPRFTGLLKYINHYDISEFKKQVNEIDWENPPQNPSQKELRELKRTLIKKCQKFIEN
ncbi:MAG TPA: hypothetical protein EYH25_02210 [Thermotoga sp.]|nr:hypothetical protein [Thermotoga sp.]